MDRAPDRLPTTTTGEPVATVPSGPLPTAETPAETPAEVEEAEQNEQGQGVRFEVPDPSEDDDEGDEEEEDEEGEEEESDNGMDVDDTELHPTSVRV
jgi:hypothetical protein